MSSLYRSAKVGLNLNRGPSTRHHIHKYTTATTAKQQLQQQKKKLYINLKTNEGIGKYLEASRPIAKGQVFLQEE